jgi:hypothetical protein
MDPPVFVPEALLPDFPQPATATATAAATMTDANRRADFRVLRLKEILGITLMLPL